MCGIAGIWNLNGEKLSENKLRKFTDSLSHRGPDGAGYFLEEETNFGLGHRRLSILDLSDAAKQPMSFADGRFQITYNGEIFNFLELREELKNKGYAFKTESDTEVILAAYHCWGKDAFLKFNGMWAMAIWDSAEKKLLLCRDRFGIKPLYYLHVPNKLFAFASETFSFKFLEGYIRKFDKKNLLLQINDANTLEGLSYTIYENIFQLLPGHYMEIQKNKYPKQKQWWNTLEHLQKVPASYNEQIEKFRELLIRSINLRLRSDVTVATALSGGVDSSSVFCSMKYLMDHNPDKQRIPSDWQQAFIATFPGTSADEKIYAEEIITYTGLKGNFIRLNDENLYERIVSTTIKSDSIIASPILAQCMVYEQMKKSGVKVSMDGHGVDEMLFGYPWLVKAAYNFYKENSDSKNKTDLENTYVDLFHEAERNRIRKELFQEKKSSTGFKRILKNTPIHKLYSSFKKPSALQGLSDKPYNLKNLNSAEQIIFNCFHTSTLPTLLMSFDRASMQNGVEVRMPFMDWQLVTFIFSLPLQSKVGNGCTKRILRDAMRGIVPEKILSRKTKIGLMAPMYDWFNNKISDAIIDELNSNSFLNSEFWNGNELAAYATQKTKSKTWQGMECSAFWNIYNAHLLLKNN